MFQTIFHVLCETILNSIRLYLAKYRIRKTHPPAAPEGDKALPRTDLL